jgi:hypothetical protein
VCVCVCLCVCVCARACVCVRVRVRASVWCTSLQESLSACYEDEIEVGGSLACDLHAAHSHRIEANTHIRGGSSTADTYVHYA